MQCDFDYEISARGTDWVDPSYAFGDALAMVDQKDPLAIAVALRETTEIAGILARWLSVLALDSHINATTNGG